MNADLDKKFTLSCFENLLTMGTDTLVLVLTLEETDSLNEETKFCLDAIRAMVAEQEVSNG